MEKEEKMTGQNSSMFNLRSQDEPYRVAKDEQGTWRVLYTWHPELVNYGPDDDIPDTHPAVTVVTEGAFIALMKESIIQGYKMSYDVPDNYDESHRPDVEAMKNKIDELNSENDRLTLELEKSNKQSETAQLAQAKLALLDKAISLGKTEAEILQSIARIGGNSDV